MREDVGSITGHYRLKKRLIAIELLFQDPKSCFVSSKMKVTKTMLIRSEMIENNNLDATETVEYFETFSANLSKTFLVDSDNMKTGRNEFAV